MDTKIEAKHTPGPWNASKEWEEPAGLGIHLRVYAGAREPRNLIALVEGMPADADLIAAAPAMLAALQRFVAHMDGEHEQSCNYCPEMGGEPESHCTCGFHDAAFAIAQAEGRAQ